jgi:hypothetical protein
MTRFDLIPRFDFGRWGGATLTNPTGRNEQADGFCLCIQWLGLMVEIGAGRVSRIR